MEETKEGFEDFSNSYGFSSKELDAAGDFLSWWLQKLGGKTGNIKKIFIYLSLERGKGSSFFLLTGLSESDQKIFHVVRSDDFITENPNIRSMIGETDYRDFMDSFLKRLISHFRKPIELWKELSRNNTEEGWLKQELTDLYKTKLLQEQKYKDFEVVNNISVTCKEVTKELKIMEEFLKTAIVTQEEANAFRLSANSFIHSLRLMTKEVDLEDLNLSVRAYNVLKRASIFSLTDLLERSEKQLLQLKNCNKVTIIEIKEVISKYGCVLRK